MFLLYLQYLLIDFRQTFVTGASWVTDDLITFLGQKVKVQGHTIAAEAHSTRLYRRVQLFLVRYLIDYILFVFLCFICSRLLTQSAVWSEHSLDIIQYLIDAKVSIHNCSAHIKQYVYFNARFVLDFRAG